MRQGKARPVPKFSQAPKSRGGLGSKLSAAQGRSQVCRAGLTAKTWHPTSQQHSRRPRVRAMSQINPCDLRTDADEVMQPAPPTAGRGTLPALEISPDLVGLRRDCPQNAPLKPRRPPRLAENLESWLFCEDREAGHQLMAVEAAAAVEPGGPSAGT